MNEYLVSLAAQVPIVAVFAWFVVRGALIAEERMAKRDREWQAWLELNREVQTETIERLTGHIERLATQIGKLSTIIIYHDATVRGENPDVVGSTKELLERLNG